MPVTYDPKDAVMCLPAGEYDGQLLSCVEGLSKAGNTMLTLVWEVTDDDGQTHKVTDYISLPKLTFKIKRIAQAFGKLRDFESAKFQPEDYIGTSCRLVLTVQKQDGFDDKNQIGGYRAFGDDASANGNGKPKFAPPSDQDKDIPF